MQVHAGAFEPPPVHGVLRGQRGTAGGFTWVRFDAINAINPYA